MILYKRKIYFIFILFFLTVSNSFGQDPHFSQFYANPIYLNPAFAGTINCPRFSINYRDQWPAIKNSFRTISVSYDQHISVLHGGIGAIVTADLQGEGGMFQTYNAAAMYNFRLQAARNFNLQFAMQAGYLRSSLNWDKLRFVSEMLEGGVPGEIPADFYNPKSQFDIALGMVGYTPYLYFGLAVHHLMPLKMSFFKHPTENWGLKWTGHVGGKITITKKKKHSEEPSFGDISFYPNVIFISQGGFERMMQGSFHYLHEGFYFSFYPFTIGTWIRHNFAGLDAFIISCGIEYKFFRIGYSYDFNLTQLERTGGAHEVSLQFVIPCTLKPSPEKKKKLPPLQCPRF